MTIKFTKLRPGVDVWRYLDKKRQIHVMYGYDEGTPFSATYFVGKAQEFKNFQTIGAAKIHAKGAAEYLVMLVDGVL